MAPWKYRKTIFSAGDKILNYVNQMPPVTQLALPTTLNVNRISRDWKQRLELIFYINRLFYGGAYTLAVLIIRVTRFRRLEKNIQIENKMNISTVVLSKKKKSLSF